MLNVFKGVDKTLLISIALLLIFGLAMFSSAALGVLAVNEAKFYGIIKSQLIYAFFGGFFVLGMGAFISHEWYRRYAYHIFAAALFFTALVFFPPLSMYHGGAHRWIDFGFITMQPSESLKFAFAIVVAYWCSTKRHLFADWKYGLLPFVIGLCLVAGIMLLQPDFGTFSIILASGFSVYFVGGARKKHLLILCALGVLGFILLVSVRPYMLERIKTFVHDAHDPRGSSWQINQSLIAIGSGGLFGRGLGQSVQKFNYLPEPIGDSIYAVTAEELGLLGTVIVIGLYAIVAIRGYIISLNARSQFGMLLGVGIVTVLLTQATINVASMLGIFPLTGVPLPLISHGGTALMATLFQLGVLLNISKTAKLT